MGEDPDGGTCDGVLAWHVDRVSIDGVDVSGRTLAVLAHIPGNVLKGNWRPVVFVDDQATTAQEESLLAVWTGKKGAPWPTWSSWWGEVAGVERAPSSSA